MIAVESSLQAGYLLGMEEDLFLKKSKVKLIATIAGTLKFIENQYTSIQGPSWEIIYS